MLKNDISAIEEQFNQECTVIELKYEYPGYTGIEKYAIVSSLSQKEIETRFPEQARSYSPFLVLDSLLVCAKLGSMSKSFRILWDIRIYQLL